MMKLLNKRLLLAAGLSFAVLACSDGAKSGPNMNAGEWEITFSAKMGDMEMPATTVKQCITADALVPQQSGSQSDCKDAQVTVVGDTVTWKMDCEPSKGEGSITYNGDTMEGTMVVTSGMGGMNFNMESKISGKRVGDCSE